MSGSFSEQTLTTELMSEFLTKHELWLLVQNWQSWSHYKRQTKVGG